MERTSRRLRASDLTAEARAGELDRLVQRDAAVRSLAQESATPQSVRQLADRFARHARSMVGADGVAVLAGPSSSARAAGEPSDAPLGVDGRAPEATAVERWVEEAARTGRPVRPDDSLVVLPLLAGTGSLAVAAIAMPRGRPLEDEELEGLLLLGRIIGEAMARSELNAVSRRDAGRASEAAERIGRLQSLAASLGRELDGEAIARLVVDAASDGTASSVGVLSRVDGDRAELELLHARGYPVGLLERERRLPLHASLPAPTVARTGRADPRRRRRLDGRVPGRQRPARDGRARPGRRAARRRAGAARGAPRRPGRTPPPTTTTTSASSTRSPSTPPRRSAARSSSTSCATATAASA